MHFLQYLQTQKMDWLTMRIYSPQTASALPAQMGRRAGRYVAAADVSLLNPVVTANAAGQGILAGNVIGRGTNLTLAYAPVTLTSHGALG